MLRGLGVPALARGARFPSPSSSPCTPAIASPSTAWSRTGAGRTAPRAWSSRSGARTSTGRRRRSAPPAGSVQREHRLAREAPGHEVLRDLTDLLPGPLEAHVGYELPRRHELGEPPEAHRRALAVTRAPESRASCTAKSPTPPVAPVTRTRRPRI